MFVVGLDPIFVQVGPVQITWTGFFVAIGIVASVLLAEYQLRKRDFPDGFARDCALFVLPAGLAGARLFHVADHWGFYAVHPLQAITTGGAALDGAVVGGLIACLTYLRRRGVSPLAPLDAIVVASLSGLALGSFGSFVAGDDYGRVATFGPAVIYPHLAKSANLQPGLYPVDLYEALLYLLGFVTLTRLNPTTRNSGTFFGAFLVVFGLDQFGLGFLREQPVDVDGLGQAQFVGAILGMVGALVLTTVATRRMPVNRLSG